MKTKLMCGALILTCTTNTNAQIINKTDAISLGLNVVKWEAQIGKKSWANSVKYTVTDIRDIKGNLKAYELSIYDKNSGKPKGYVNIPVEEGFGIVSTFNYDGNSKSDLLEKNYQSKWLKQIKAKDGKVLEKKLIGSQSGAFAIGVKIDKNLNIANARKVGNYHVFTIYPIPNIDEETGYKKTQDHSTRSVKRVNSDLINEERNTRKQFVKGVPDIDANNIQKGSYDANMLSTFNRSSSPTGSGSIANTKLSTLYNQEYRRWNNGTCYAGCLPVASAIVLEYWDRNGFNGMINSRTISYKNKHTHSDVRNMINQLRGYMGTWCNSDNQGETYFSRQPGGMKRYIESKGFRGWNPYNSRWGKANHDAWNKLRSEIDNKRPVIAGISSNSKKANHSVVVYSYEDHRGTSLDKFCYATGWGRNLPTQCAYRSKHYNTTVVW